MYILYKINQLYFGIIKVFGFSNFIWRWNNLVIIVPGTILLALFALFLPESPRWLIQNGQLENALETMYKLRKDSTEAKKEFELNLIFKYKLLFKLNLKY